jgi:hypothetical protein
MMVGGRCIQSTAVSGGISFCRQDDSTILSNSSSRSGTLNGTGTVICTTSTTTTTTIWHHAFRSADS